MKRNNLNIQKPINTFSLLTFCKGELVGRVANADADADGLHYLFILLFLNIVFLRISKGETSSKI